MAGNEQREAICSEVARIIREERMKRGLSLNVLAERARQSMIADGLLDPEHVYGTIHCHALGPTAE